MNPQPAAPDPEPVADPPAIDGLEFAGWNPDGTPAYRVAPHMVAAGFEFAGYRVVALWRHPDHPGRLVTVSDGAPLARPVSPRREQHPVSASQESQDGQPRRRHPTPAACDRLSAAGKTALTPEQTRHAELLAEQAKQDAEYEAEKALARVTTDYWPDNFITSKYR